MRQLPNDKYTVAWFKLAEFIARGEKERALGIFRLLAHSFDNEALAAQLEGDILLSFDDRTGALACYERSADYYHHNKKFIEAAAIHEHINLLQPNRQSFEKLVDYYDSCGKRERLATIAVDYCEFLIGQAIFDEAVQVTEYVQPFLRSEQRIPFYKRVIGFLWERKNVQDKLLETLIKQSIDATKSAEWLSGYLKTLEPSRKETYAWVSEYAKKLSDG